MERSKDRIRFPSLMTERRIESSESHLTLLLYGNRGKDEAVSVKVALSIVQAATLLLFWLTVFTRSVVDLMVGSRHEASILVLLCVD